VALLYPGEMRHEGVPALFCFGAVPSSQRMGSVAEQEAYSERIRRDRETIVPQKRSWDRGPIVMVNVPDY